MSRTEHPVLLIVLDGWGHRTETTYNAIASANKPCWDELVQRYPNTVIRCSGSDVGLPAAQMGNSEVGHMHLGAGRTIDQDFTRISRAVERGGFDDNAAFAPAFRRAADDDRAVHVLGLASPGGVHSHEDHIVALVQAAARAGVERIFVHAFLDGRDTPPRSAAPSLERLAACCAETGVARVASVVGRYYAMDRNANWDRTREAWQLIVDGDAPYVADDAAGALRMAYDRDESDEFVKPTAIRDGDGRTVTVADGDVVVFANFRADRARQLTTAFTDPAFDGFEPARRPRLGAFVTMTGYGEQYDVPVAFPPDELQHGFGEWIAARGLRQLRIAETEKYAHVTFFFNGGAEAAEAGEDRILIDSPDVATYDLKPEMSAREVTDALVEAIESARYDTIICNYANADMVGHTGDFDATVRCIEVLDECLGRVVTSARMSGMEILITADHGNAELMREERDDGAAQAHTAHTTNVVPLIYIGRAATLEPDGCLSDIAPTMLHLMDVPIPPEMTGRPLVVLSDDEQAAA